MNIPNVVALLPMKGHSERIPRKNLKHFNGRPLFLWILETLLEVSEVDRVVINTDSQEIADVALQYANVVIHERPEDIRGDFVSMNRIIEYDIERVEDADVFLQTHATNPLLKPKTIRCALEAFDLQRPKHDSLFSVTAFRERFYEASAKPLNHDPSDLGRTQDLQPLYMENSNIYLFSRHSFAKRRHRIGLTPQMFEMSRLEAIDIDEPADWEIAKAILSQSRG